MDEPNNASTPPASPPAKPPRRWRRRLRIAVLLMLFLLISSRVIIVLLLPPVLHRVAGYYGLDATYQRLELSVLSGDTGLWHLVITPKTGGDPIAVVDYCRGDISPLNLLRGRLVVWRAEADGVNVDLTRQADGTIPLLKLLARNSPTSTTPTPAAVAAAKNPGRIDLTPPLRLDALRLSHIKLHLHDQAVTPALDAVVGINVRLSDLGSTTGRLTNFSADVDADPILDALHVTGQGQTRQGTLDATFSADVNGLRLRPLTPYLALLGVRPLANETTLHAGGSLTLGPSPANPSVAAAVLKLNDVQLLADGEEAAAVGRLALIAPSLDPRRLALESLSLQDVRLQGRRSAGGALRFAGLEYVGIPAAAASAAAPPPPAGSAALPILDLPLVDLRNVSAQFHDDAVSPPAQLTMQLDQLQVKRLLLDPATPDSTVTLAGVAHLPGIAGTVHLDGSARPMAATKSLALTVAADGVALDAIQPYLDPLGLRSTIHNGTFTAAVHADATLVADGVDVTAAVTQVLLKQDATLLAMDHLRVDHAHLGHTLAVQDISIAGPTLSIHHEADGTLAAAGFQFDPRRVARTAPPSTPSTLPTAPALPTIPALPAVAIGHFRWDGIDVAYDDDTLTPPLHTRVADAGVDYRDGQFSASAKVPQVVEQLALNGSVGATPQTVTAGLKLNATGINATVAAPFLEPLHVQPTLHDGGLRATADATLRLPGQAIDGSLHLSDVQYTDGPQELAGVDRLAVDAVHFTPQGLSVGQIQIDRPRATVTRESGGAFAAAGVRVLPAAWATSSSSPASRSAATTRPATAPDVAPFAIALDHFHLAGGTLHWIDQQKSVDTTASADLDLQHLARGADAATPATLALQAAVAGVFDTATVNGTITPDPANPQADLSIQATHLRAGPLAAYLPDSLSVPLHDGAFRTHVQLAAGAAPAGGVSAQLIATDLDYRQAGDAEPLLKLDSARLLARRVDPATNVFQLAEVSTAGVELSAQRTADGGVRALGAQLHPSTAEPADVDAIPASDTIEPAEPQSVHDLLAAATPKPLRLQLDQLDLNLRRITLLDEQRPAAAPLVIENAELKNLDRIDWGGNDPDAKPPTHFRLSGALHPAVGNLVVNATVTPLAVQPTAAVDVLATGIDGAGVTALLPELRPRVKAGSLTAGEFHLHLDASARLSRRGATQIDYTGPIEADVDLKPVTFRATPGGPILAGLDELHSDGIHFEPKNGSLHVKTLELTNPIGRVTRETDGLHVLGVVLPTATPTTPPTTTPQPPGTKLAVAPLRNPTTAPALRPTKPTAEIRVDQLVITDLDFVATDNTVDPPLVVPLNGADVEVRGFTNFAPYEDKPLKFSAMVNAGKVTLPKPLASSGLGGAFGDAAKLMAGKRVATHRATEQRELFAEATANGSIGLYPAPNGYIKTNLGGFELASLTSTAAQYGVSLSDGVFDSTIDATLPGDGSIQTQAKFVLTDLGISEPPNGPIFRYLHLPAPLDTVVGVLEDQEGSITVPLEVPVKKDSLSAAALAGPAVSAFGSIVATAVASTPFKAASGLTDLLGIGGKKTAAPEPPVLLAFDPGDVTLTPADELAIAQLRARLIADPSLTMVVKHTLGGGDVADARMRANPSPQVAQLLAQQMRQQQLASAQLRSDLAGVVRSDLERGAAAEPTIDQLRQVDQQMAHTDDAMDRLFELMRPGADRMASRRTRAVCLDYGKQRLATIRSALTDHAPADVADRIHLLSPQYAQPADDAGGTVLIQLVPKL